MFDRVTGRWPVSVRVAAPLTALVVLAAYVLSYDALVALARASGIRPVLSWAYPGVVDGMLTVGIVAAIALRDAHLRTRAYVWAIIGASTATTVCANAAHPVTSRGGIGEPWAALASAVPALSLACALHLLVVIVRHAHGTHPQPLTANLATHESALATDAPILEPAEPVPARTMTQLHTLLDRTPDVTGAQAARELEVSEGHARRLLRQARIERNGRHAIRHSSTGGSDDGA